MEKLLGSASAAHVTPAQWANITGKRFFPNLISEPFMKGLRITLTASMVMSLIAAWASWMRGARYVHDEWGDGGDASGRSRSEAGAGHRVDPDVAQNGPGADADRAPEPEPEPRVRA